jgi:hypothetical protein
VAVGLRVAAGRTRPFAGGIAVVEAPEVQAHAEHAESEHVEEDIWQHMPPSLQAELQDEDADAWRHVVGVLLLIISVGLALAMFTTWLTGRLS